MRLISGVAVEVLRPGAATVDAHGNEVAGEPTAETVGGVLPQPGTTEDLEASRPEGVVIAMTFHFPKSYAASLKGCSVRYAGRAWRVVGDPQPYLGANCPGEWNRAVGCEACDG